MIITQCECRSVQDMPKALENEKPSILKDLTTPSNPLKSRNLDKSRTAKSDVRLFGSDLAIKRAWIKQANYFHMVNHENWTKSKDHNGRINNK